MSEKQEQNSLRLELLERTQTLMTAGFGLVAALAWNTAIQDLFKLIFPDQGSIIAKFSYALFITIVVVLVTRRIGKSIAALKEKVK